LGAGVVGSVIFGSLESAPDVGVLATVGVVAAVVTGALVGPAPGAVTMPAALLEPPQAARPSATAAAARAVMPAFKFIAVRA
jgi:hypothetical protein